MVEYSNQKESRANLPEKKEKSIVPILIVALLAIAVAFGGTFAYSQYNKAAEEKSAADISKAKEAYDKEVSAKYVEEQIDAGKDVVVFIGRATCSHCVTFHPVVDEYAKENNKFFYYIDMDKQENINFLENSKYLVVEGTPTVRFFKAKKKTNELVGESSKEDLAKAFEKAGF